MNDDNLIKTVNGPVIEHMLQPQTSGVIYSVSLSNGMVVTSPEGFEAVANVIGHKYGKHDKFAGSRKDSKRAA